MPTEVLRQRRRRFRLLTAFCLGLAPGLGAQLTLAQLGPEGPSGIAFVHAVLISSVVVHLAMGVLSRHQTNRARLLFAGASLLGLFMLPGMIQLPGLPASLPPQSGITPIIVIAAWVVGLVLAMICRSLRKLMPRERSDAAHGFVDPTHLVLSALVLTAGFWLTASALPLLKGGLFMPARSLPAFLGAFQALVIGALLVRAILVMQSSHENAGVHPALPTGCAIVAMVLVASLQALPQIAVLGQNGAAVLLMLGVTLLAVAMSTQAALHMTLAIALLALSLAFSTTVAGASMVISVTLVLVLGMLLANLGLRPHAGDTPNVPKAHGSAPPDIRRAYDRISGTWLVQFDFDLRVVRFADGAGAALGVESEASFTDLFSNAHFGGLVDLIQALQTDGPAPETAIELQLAVRGQDGGEIRLETFGAHVLKPGYPTAWVALRSLSGEKALRDRLQRYEGLVAEAVLREERLLSIASHELRTPIAILTMLADELEAGTPWTEVNGNVVKTLQRITAILDDLRAGSGTEGGSPTSITPREIAHQVVEYYDATARANGITLTTDLGDKADTPILCDFSRVLIALSKLVHNAVVHSKGTEATISAFLTSKGETAMQVAWQVSDNGIGIPPERAASAFEPFESGADKLEDRTGLGLYTARKAVRLMGGDLVHHDEAGLTRFVMTHPVRIDTSVSVRENKGLSMDNVSPLHGARTALLIEDNKLVGEITCTRLRKLFAHVDWCEAGDEGLAMFQNGNYDLVVVDQLLPGMIGSEIVREIRRTHPDLPIVGITASTMGAECQDLEAAGVNYALEKPLSFAQLKSLAEEFFGSPEASAEA